MFSCKFIEITRTIYITPLATRLSVRSLDFALCSQLAPTLVEMRLLCLLCVTCFGFGASETDNSTLKGIQGGYHTDPMNAPWHVGLYKVGKIYKQICGGTIIASNVVVTAAHCVSKDDKVWPASEFAVGAGKIYRAWDNFNDVGAQKSNVREIKLPPRYQGVVANYQEDIALLILVDAFVYTNFVQPACVSFNAHFDTLQLREGQLGKVVGWGLSGLKSKMSRLLRGATLPCVAIENCISQSPQSFKSYITGDKICAGYQNGNVFYICIDN
ncbi:hypothetical protein O3G_MSEX011968 [Manduca sexta]|uniref:Peptidase S1 domain-containing protein n=1 Tax=Manduca sexta TaxID=7130 RepID=A0A922CWD1_MANSE|nr:hypothetical protein O3G_MSEX011968 [Manduca sexta]